MDNAPITQLKAEQLNCKSLVDSPRWTGQTPAHTVSGSGDHAAVCAGQRPFVQGHRDPSEKGRCSRSPCADSVLSGEASPESALCQVYPLHYFAPPPQASNVDETPLWIGYFQILKRGKKQSSLKMFQRSQGCMLNKT